MEPVEKIYTLVERTSKVEERLTAMEKSVIIALESINERLLGMNEFRETLKDQQGTFITRAELWGYFIGLAGILFGLIQLLK